MRKYIVKYFYWSTPNDIDSDYHAILMNYSNYYIGLNSDLKKEFRLRVFRLLNVLSFSSSKDLTVSREIRVVIGSAIIQITFGLRSYLPIKFVNVVVLPTRYMYPGYGEPFLGHIDYTTNTLYFSWQDVQNGYAIADDAVNVALHEMAHVIEAENRYRYLMDDFFAELEWTMWAEVAFAKMEIIRSGNNRFLKSYGGHNMSEMFAVCIEAFFERPNDFKETLPVIYNTICNLLKQDPCNKVNPRDIYN